VLGNCFLLWLYNSILACSNIFFARFWQIKSKLYIYMLWIYMSNFITVWIIFAEIWFILYLPNKWYFKK